MIFALSLLNDLLTDLYTSLSTSKHNLNVKKINNRMQANTAKGFNTHHKGSTKRFLYQIMIFALSLLNDFLTDLYKVKSTAVLSLAKLILIAPQHHLIFEVLNPAKSLFRHW